MDPLSILFYVVMAMLALAVAYFLLSFVRILLLEVLKLIVMAFPLVLSAGPAFYFWTQGKNSWAIGALVVGVILTLVLYPKKERIEVEGTTGFVRRWKPTPRGKLISKLDKQLSKS
jgi:hypothetical protein